MNVKKLQWFLGSDSGVLAELPYLSTDRAVLTGVGPAPSLGYITFGGTDQDSNGRKYSTWRKGSNHNGAGDGDIILYMQDYNSTTLSPIITVRADVASYNYTNPNVFVGDNNRVFVTYSKQKAASAYEPVSPSDIYYVYSDDIYSKSIPDISTATWSSELRLTSDYGELITSSSTSVNLNTVVVSSPLTITIGTGLNIATNGTRRLKIASIANTNNNVTGTVTAYNSGTGSITINVISKNGTTTASDWDAGLSSYIDGPGKAIHLGGGVLLKPVWTTLGGTSSVMIYRSTDNGETWSFLSTITNDSINPNDETCIIKLPNGNIFAAIRCNSLNVIRFSTSTNNGATWSALVNSTIPSHGKSPIAVSPSGQLVGLCRHDVNDRTLWFYNTTPGDYTTFNYGYIDAREGSYMYGGVLWDSTGNKFIADWAVEAQNSEHGSGPTVIITKDIVMSSSPISPPTVYDPYAQSVFDFSQANGEAEPSDILKGKINTWFTSLRNNGFLTLIDYMRAPTGDAALFAIRNRNWIYPWETATVVNNPTSTNAGYSFNGIDQRVVIGAVATHAVPQKWTKASATSVGIYYVTPTATQDPANGNSYGVVQFQLRTRNVDGNAVYTVADSTGTTITNASGAGRYFTQRTDANTKNLWKNGTLISTASVAGIALGSLSQPINIGCLNNTGTPARFREEVETMFIVSSAFNGNEALYDSINLAYLTSLGL